MTTEKIGPSYRIERVSILEGKPRPKPTLYWRLTVFHHDGHITEIMDVPTFRGLVMILARQVGVVVSRLTVKVPQ